MRIKISLAVVLAALTIFFGYLAYREFIFDDTAAAKTVIATEIAQMTAQQQPNDQKPPEYYGHKRAEIALQEYSKNIVELTPGCNCGPEIDKYTENSPAQWCTMFASWVANQAGSPLLDVRTGAWRISNSRMFIEHLKGHGTWYSRDEIVAKGLKPQLGDFVAYWRGDIEDNLGHIDIVVDTNGAPGTAGLIGGNIKDRIIYRENFPYLNYYGFLGFGRPEK